MGLSSNDKYTRIEHSLETGDLSANIGGILPNKWDKVYSRFPWIPRRNGTFNPMF